MVIFRCLQPLWEIAPHFGASSTPSTTSTAPWSGQQPYLTGNGTTPGVLPSAAALYSNPADYPQYYPNNTYAPLTGTQQTLIGGIENYGAGGGNSALNSANSALTNQLNPNQLNPFAAPGFQNVINQTLAQVLPQTSASFISGGRADSGLAQAAQTSAATNAIGSLANNNYLAEQQNQLKAGLEAPIVDQQQMGDLTTALGAAGQDQANAQNQINANVAQWNYNQALPFNMLGQYQNFVGGTGYGGMTTTPMYSNNLANTLSGITGGLGLANGLGTATSAGGALSSTGTLAGLLGLFM